VWVNHPTSSLQVKRKTIYILKKKKIKIDFGFFLVLRVRLSEVGSTWDFQKNESILCSSRKKRERELGAKHLWGETRVWGEEAKREMPGF